MPKSASIAQLVAYSSTEAIDRAIWTYQEAPVDEFFIRDGSVDNLTKPAP